MIVITISKLQDSNLYHMGRDFHCLHVAEVSPSAISCHN
nr:MAG TPA: hypothetical protein [Caudoviricetes sp.]